MNLKSKTTALIAALVAAVISALDAVSDVQILQSPSVLVRNNVEADFSSGQQIPVASTILNNNGGTNQDNTYSQVQFRQTGVSLKVKPRISSDGMVFMEITQDVSSPSSTGPEIGGNISVDNNKLHTEVAVQTGATSGKAAIHSPMRFFDTAEKAVREGVIDRDAAHFGLIRRRAEQHRE